MLLLRPIFLHLGSSRDPELDEVAKARLQAPAYVVAEAIQIPSRLRQHPPRLVIGPDGTTLPPLLLKGDTGIYLLLRALSLDESDSGTCLFEGLLEGLEGVILSCDTPRQMLV